jgi:predicted O-methyltransferase YrrM
MIWVLENVLTHPSAKATALDIFPDDLQERFTRNIQKSGFADKVSVIKGGSQIVLRDLPPASCDIIYIDGDHSAPAVLADALYSWPLLKEGGILIFDDYLYKIEERPPEKRPKISIDAFASSFREYIDTLSMEKQFIVRKKAKIYWEDF